MSKFRVPISHNKSVEITEPERSQFPDNLGGAFEYSLARALTRILYVTGEGLVGFAAGFFVKLLEILEPEYVDYLSPMLDEILAIPGLPPGFKASLESIRNPHGQAAAALLSGVGGSATGTVVSSLLGVLTAPTVMGLNHKIHPSRPSPAEAWAMSWRDGQLSGTAREWMLDQGWPDEAINAFANIIRPRPGVGDLFQMMLRGLRPRSEVENELTARGYTAEDTEHLLELSKVIPGIGDLIRFMVRDVYHPAVVAKYGYDQQFPEAVLEWTRKQGLTDDWARAYWRAHWQLPSPQAAAEMVHRAGVSEADYIELLKINDYAPFWVDKFLKLIYSPYTRVDIRRMHQLGILSEAEVKAAYKEIGYDDDKAAHLTAFTVQEYGEAAKKDTKSELLKAYEIGLLTRQEVSDLLVQLRYPEYLINMEIAKTDYHRILTHVNAVARAVGKLYKAGRLSQSDAAGELGKLNIPGAMQNMLFERWTWERRAKVAVPTRAIVTKWYIDNIISEADFMSALAGLGYDAKARANFLTEAKTHIYGPPA